MGKMPEGPVEMAAGNGPKARQGPELRTLNVRRDTQGEWTMVIRAKMSFRYIWRLGLIALICLGGSVYCLYDGAIGYPAQRQRALAYLELKKQGLNDRDTRIKWEELAAERDWPLDEPGKPKNEIDFTFQFVLAGCLGPIGLLYLFLFLRSLRRWIELDESGLRTSWGCGLEFSQIVALDKKKWKTKGIALIRYKQNGRMQQLALDDWKFDVGPTKAILREIESRIDFGRITGGPPESVQEPTLVAVS